MENKRLFLAEQILLIVALFFSLWGFWYFEESLILRISVIVLSILGIYFLFSKKRVTEQFSSRRELPILLILYLGILTLYNLLYGVSLPLYVVMLAILVLTSVLFYSLFSLDGFDKILGRQLFYALVVVLGIVVLEVFLSLYFWPIGPETKSLILVVIFYLIMSLIYLYIHSMLRLKRIIGYLVVSAVILGGLLLLIWLGLAT